ncbi:MAG: hypothetical protein ACYDC1_20155 [Limisphaerales bacterium]
MSKPKKPEATAPTPASTEAELPGTGTPPEVKPETPAAQSEPIAPQPETAPTKTEPAPTKPETPKLSPVDALTRAFQLLEFADNLICRQIPAAPSQDIDSIRGHWTNLYEGFIQERAQPTASAPSPSEPPPDGQTVIILLSYGGKARRAEAGYYSSSGNQYYFRQANRFLRVEEPLKVVGWRPLP